MAEASKKPLEMMKYDERCFEYIKGIIKDDALSVYTLKSLIGHLQSLYNFDSLIYGDMVKSLVSYKNDIYINPDKYNWIMDILEFLMRNIYGLHIINSRMFFLSFGGPKLFWGPQTILGPQNNIYILYILYILYIHT